MPWWTGSRPGGQRWSLAGVAALTAVVACGAQEGKVVPSVPGTPYTLHVYANRVQVPTMVLDKQQATETGLSAGNFTMRLDKGPKFHPLQVHVEGDDPLTVAVVLDVTSAVGPEMLMNFELELAQLPGALLTERDHVSVYAMDCKMVQAAETDIPATKDGLRKAVQAVVNSTAVHGDPNVALGCDGSRRLWDALAVAGKQIGSLPGRRVMIVVSDGSDSSSVNQWNRVAEYLDSLDVTVLGIRSGGMPLMVSGPKKNQVAEDPFSLLCEGTGGVTLDSDVNTVGPTLEKAIRLVRERYILEFLRPSNAIAGIHSMDVRVPDRKAIVRPGGVLVEMEDPGLAKDPSVVPTDQSQAPQLGKRRALTRTQ